MTGIMIESFLNGWSIKLYERGIDVAKYVARTHSEALSIVDDLLSRQAKDLPTEQVPS